MTSENGKYQAERLYKELLSLVQATEDKMQGSTNFDLEKTLDLGQAREALKVATSSLVINYFKSETPPTRVSVFTDE